MSTPITSNTLSRHQLIAALRAGGVLDDQGTDIASVEASYLRLPTEGVFDVDSLRRGGELLRDVGLVIERDGRLCRDRRLDELLSLGEDLACRLLLAVALSRFDPLWLRAAADRDGGVATELIPDDVQQALSVVVIDPEEREALLLALANKVDASSQAETGDLGERFVVDQCRAELLRLGRPELASCVRQVSLVSDQLGYDVVAPDTAGGAVRIEVKTTRKVTARDVPFFLSRNEARVALRDTRWRLVICRVDDGGSVTIVGTCSGAALASILPADTPRGRWTSASLALPMTDFAPGIPRLAG